MKENREKQIQDISNLWKKLANMGPARKEPKDNILNLIDENLNEKYFRFLVCKIKIPQKSMQIQISQMLEQTNDKNEIFVASSLEDIPKNLTCKEQIINYEKVEG